MLALWKLLLNRSPPTTQCFVKLDADAWVVNLPQLYRELAKATDAGGRPCVWGRCKPGLALRSGSVHHNLTSSWGVLLDGGATWRPRGRLYFACGGLYALSRVSAASLVPRLGSMHTLYRKHVDTSAGLAGGLVQEDRLMAFSALMAGVPLVCASSPGWFESVPATRHGWGPSGPPRCVNPAKVYVGHPFKNGTLRLCPTNESAAVQYGPRSGRVE